MPGTVCPEYHSAKPTHWQSGQLSARPWNKHHARTPAILRPPAGSQFASKGAVALLAVGSLSLDLGYFATGRIGYPKPLYSALASSILELRQQHRDPLNRP